MYNVIYYSTTDKVYVYEFNIHTQRHKHQVRKLDLHYRPQKGRRFEYNCHGYDPQYMPAKTPNAPCNYYSNNYLFALKDTCRFFPSML